MVAAPTEIQCLKASMRLSSVVPATATDQEQKVHELSNLDLAVKLHYIKGIYFFTSDAVGGIKGEDVKRPMFHLLKTFFVASGRIRKSEMGRPFIKCNDAGVRTVETCCDQTIDEWLAMAAEEESVFEALAYNQALGDPHLGFSPLVFVQFTWFKCGGMSVGLSWAHVLGDAFSATAFINMWGKILAGHQVPHKSPHVPSPSKSELPLPTVATLLKPTPPNTLKCIDSVGDVWLTPKSSNMKSHTFHVPAQKFDTFFSDIPKAKDVTPFELLSAIIWKTLSKINDNPGEKRMVTTVCKKDKSHEMVWSTVEADFWVGEAQLSEVVELILKKRIVENDIIREMEMGSNNESEEEFCLDFIAYGANLTFVNLEEAEIYGIEMKGHKPMYANLTISGVGDEGLVLVLPAGPKYENGDRTVTVVLPENGLAQLRDGLERDWSFA